MNVICGSCRQLLLDPEGDACPRCKRPIHPDPETRLRQFIEKGTDPTKGGVPLKEAQDAADQILGAFLHMLDAANQEE